MLRRLDLARISCWRGGREVGALCSSTSPTFEEVFPCREPAERVLFAKVLVVRRESEHRIGGKCLCKVIHGKSAPHISDSQALVTYGSFHQWWYSPEKSDRGGEGSTLESVGGLSVGE